MTGITQVLTTNEVVTYNDLIRLIYGDANSLLLKGIPIVINNVNLSSSIIIRHGDLSDLSHVNAAYEEVQLPIINAIGTSKILFAHIKLNSMPWFYTRVTGTTKQLAIGLLKNINFNSYPLTSYTLEQSIINTVHDNNSLYVGYWNQYNTPFYGGESLNTDVNRTQYEAKAILIEEYQR